MILAELISADDDVRSLVSLAASVTAETDHILARSIRDYAEALGISPTPAAARRFIADHGVEAEIDGRTLRLTPVVDNGDLPSDVRQRLGASRYRTWRLLRCDAVPVTIGFIAAIAGNPVPAGRVSSKAAQ